MVENIHLHGKNNDFYIVDKPSDKINLGYPLNSVSINIKNNKYFTDIESEDNDTDDKVIDFLIKHIKESNE